MAGLRIGNLLAPSVEPAYRAIAETIRRRLGLDVELTREHDYDAFWADNLDLAFVCSLAVVEAEDQLDAPPRVVAAPVLVDPRFEGNPITSSEIVVRADAPLSSFGDLRGHRWAFNEPLSQSGFGIVRQHLLDIAEPVGFFSEVVAAGHHEAAIEMVRSGRVDGAAIDVHVLGVVRARDEVLAGSLDVIDSLGPYPIQPVVMSPRIDRRSERAIVDVLLELHHDPLVAPILEAHGIERFVRVGSDHLGPIRAMRDAARAAGVTGLE